MTSSGPQTQSSLPSSRKSEAYLRRTSSENLSCCHVACTHFASDAVPIWPFRYGPDCSTQKFKLPQQQSCWGIV